MRYSHRQTDSGDGGETADGQRRAGHIQTETRSCPAHTETCRDDRDEGGGCGIKTAEEDTVETDQWRAVETGDAEKTFILICILMKRLICIMLCIGCIQSVRSDGLCGEVIMSLC